MSDKVNIDFILKVIYNGYMRLLAFFMITITVGCSRNSADNIVYCKEYYSFTRSGFLIEKIPRPWKEIESKSLSKDSSIIKLTNTSDHEMFLKFYYSRDSNIPFTVKPNGYKRFSNDWKNYGRPQLEFYVKDFWIPIATLSLKEDFKCKEKITIKKFCKSTLFFINNKDCSYTEYIN
jgi:hypothetical protein